MHVYLLEMQISTDVASIQFSVDQFSVTWMDKSKSGKIFRQLKRYGINPNIDIKVSLFNSRFWGHQLHLQNESLSEL